MHYLVIRSDRVPKGEWTLSLDDHLPWMEQRHRRGEILLSGPSPDHTKGIYLIRADSRARAEEIARSDPFTAAGLTDFELIEWDVRQAFGFGPFTAHAIRTMNPSDRDNPAVASWEDEQGGR